MLGTKRFVFSYQNLISTDVYVTKHYMLMRCLPVDCEFQSLEELDIRSYGFDSLTSGRDSFGASILYGGKLGPHQSLMWHSSGIIKQTPYELKLTENPFIYTVPTEMTFATAPMKEFLQEHRTKGSLLHQVTVLNHAVHEYFTYTPMSTNINTKASEAFMLQKGVCEDYSQVFMALLRQMKIPCRYVNGLISGDGQTHAWVEVLIDDRWFGFDPTNDNVIDYGYIKLSHGRDASDCPVVRGIFTGNATQKMTVHVCCGKL